MFLIAIIIYTANAGVIPLGHGPALVAAPVAVAHGATSYANSNLISLHPTPVVVQHAAPIAVAHAPVATLGIGLGHGALLH